MASLCNPDIIAFLFVRWFSEYSSSLADWIPCCIFARTNKRANALVKDSEFLEKAFTVKGENVVFRVCRTPLSLQPEFSVHKSIGITSEDTNCLKVLVTMNLILGRNAFKYFFTPQGWREAALLDCFGEKTRFTQASEPDAYDIPILSGSIEVRVPHGSKKTFTFTGGSLSVECVLVKDNHANNWYYSSNSVEAVPDIQDANYANYAKYAEALRMFIALFHDKPITFPYDIRALMGFNNDTFRQIIQLSNTRGQARKAAILAIVGIHRDKEQDEKDEWHGITSDDLLPHHRPRIVR
jgi:hypothetical protein